MMNRLIARLGAVCLVAWPTTLAVAQRGEAEPFVSSYIPVMIMMGLGVLMIIPSFKNAKRNQTDA